jgi:hypothetical protein
MVLSSISEQLEKTADALDSVCIKLDLRDRKACYRTSFNPSCLTVLSNK